MTTEERKEYMRVYRITNRERISAQQKIWRLNNLEHLKIKERASKLRRREEISIYNREHGLKYRPLHKDRLKRVHHEYYLRNKADIKHKVKLRKSLELNRTPIWADTKMINTIYRKCPDGYHVDHIIPLQGVIVSGLHVEYNLQYLTSAENCSKNNVYPHPEYHI